MLTNPIPLGIPSVSSCFMLPPPLPVTSCHNTTRYPEKTIHLSESILCVCGLIPLRKVDTFLGHILLSVITNTTCWWKDHKLEFPRLALCQRGRACVRAGTVWRTKMLAQSLIIGTDQWRKTFVGYAHLLFGLNKGMWSLGQSSPWRFSMVMGRSRYEQQRAPSSAMFWQIQQPPSKPHWGSQLIKTCFSH